MWPKALLELLPHLTRLVPIANRYFQSKAAGDDATRLALERKLEEVATAIRSDVQETAAASAGLAQQLKTQSSTLAQIATETCATKLSVDSLEARLTILEKRGERHSYLLAIVLLQLATICILIAVLFLTRRH